MLLGLKSLTEKFRKSADDDKLNSAYLFFGEPQVGKFTFAHSLANYLENGIFEPPDKILVDAAVLRIGDEKLSLGIDDARRVKSFLWQRPVLSGRRTVIVDNAENLTEEAQNALLKISEEPPPSSLLILIASDAQLLIPTLASRLAKIYFPRLKTEVIAGFLEKTLKVNPKSVRRLADESFGRPGRAVQLAVGGRDRREDDQNIDNFLEKRYLLLRSDLLGNSSKLAWLLDRHSLLKRYNLNRNLQLRVIRDFLSA